MADQQIIYSPSSSCSSSSSSSSSSSDSRTFEVKVENHLSVTVVAILMLNPDYYFVLQPSEGTSFSLSAQSFTGQSTKDFVHEILPHDSKKFTTTNGCCYLSVGVMHNKEEEEEKKGEQQ